MSVNDLYNSANSLVRLSPKTVPFAGTFNCHSEDRFWIGCVEPDQSIKYTEDDIKRVVEGSRHDFVDELSIVYRQGAIPSR